MTLAADFAAALCEYSSSWPAYGGSAFDPGSGEIERAWLAALDWPPNQQVGGLTMRLMGYAIAAQTASQRAQELYCWSGPAVPAYAIASGRSASDFDEYRRATRRR